MHYIFRDFNCSDRISYRYNQSEVVSKGWDGQFKGSPVETGTYYYLIKVRYLGEDQIIKGDITLLR